MLIHEAVLGAARRHPNAVAFGDDEITYGELERNVRGLAARLRAEAGVGGRVAIVAPKSPAAVCDAQSSFPVFLSNATTSRLSDPPTRQINFSPSTSGCAAKPHTGRYDS